MSQIEEYEKPYHVVFGDDGGEAKVIPGPEGPDFPIWRARQMVLAVLTAQLEKTNDEGEAEEFKKLRSAFRLAQTGEIVFGMIRKFKNRKGKQRFIGITPKGVDYREVGPPKAAPSDKFIPRFDPTLMTGVPPKKAQPRKPAAKPVSDAERIADKMAKAARKAVEGDQ